MYVYRFRVYFFWVCVLEFLHVSMITGLPSQSQYSGMQEYSHQTDYDCPETVLHYTFSDYILALTPGTA